MTIKFKIGLVFIVLGFFLPLFSFAVPFLGLPGYMSAAVIGFFIIGGPELFLIIGGVLAGKDAIKFIKSKIMSPAGKYRYMTGLFIFVFCVLFNWSLAYLEVSGIMSIKTHTWLYIMAGFDIAAVFGLLMAGPELFHKIKRIFTWEGV